MAELFNGYKATKKVQMMCLVVKVQQIRQD